MPRPSHRDKLLEVGLDVVHAQGFAGASVRDIVQAAGVPQGSFTNHFVSKEAFALEVIDLYFTRSRENIARTLRNDALPPLQRLRAYIDSSKDRLAASQMRNGCLLGNFTAEASWGSEPIRLRLLEIFGELQAAIAYCLRAAVKAGEIAPSLDCEEIAAFVVASMQGAILMSKALRSTVPVERLKEVLFSSILHRIGTASIAA
jgi:TetR/AcrR family transcriptional repressor of nem operon